VRTWRRAGAGAALVLCALLTWPALAPAVPTYRVAVTVDRQAHRITGRVEVRVGAEEALPRDEWWFHLPPNRFESPDGRGPRRHLESPQFAAFQATLAEGDPLLPEGFSEGRIALHEVTDETGRPLVHSYWVNPLLPEGYSPINALLRVRFAPGSSGRVVVFRFTTHLPHRHWEGWNDSGVFVRGWHPVLLDRRGEEWLRDPAEPTAGLYQGQVTVAQRGWLAAGRAEPRHLEPEATLILPADPRPALGLPLAFFSGLAERSRQAEGARLHSFFGRGNRRIGKLALDVAEEFLVFMKEHYGLTLPADNLTMVEVNTHPGDIRTVGNILLIPRVYYLNDPIIDRAFVGRLARALGEVWFGQTVWSHADREAWLPLGLPGYLALAFYRDVYGWDAQIHGLMDWLNPHYREHYFEEPVRSKVRNGDDAPLMISLTAYPRAEPAQVALYLKAPLVLRMLGHVMGEERFRDALGRFYARYRYGRADLLAFETVVNDRAAEPLDRFFAEWFFQTPRLDYALAGWEQEPAKGGGYRVQVEVERREDFHVPVDVLVEAEGGERVVRRWDGRAARAVLHFRLEQPVARIVIDPEEHLLETDRQNNHSQALIRLRPFFDWHKQRESLILVRGSLGGNAIDGNFVGLGVTSKLDANNEVRLIPGYGDQSRQLIYDIGWERRHFLHPRLSLSMEAEKLGGRFSRRVGLSLQHPSPEELRFTSRLDGNWESVDPQTDRNQPGGSANNLRLIHVASYEGGVYYRGSLSAALERSAPAMGSDFDYTSFSLRLNQTVADGGRHAVQLELIRAATDGDTPVQKQPLLGDPTVLRGYPRSVALVSEQLAAARLEYRYVLTRHIFGAALQSRRITGLIFGDVGKGWNNGQDPDDVPQRQDVGFGLSFNVDVLSQAAFPARLEVAFPINDPDYTQHRYILFGALTFF